VCLPGEKVPWLLLSFARDALVHLNAIRRSLAAVSKRPTCRRKRQAGTCHNADSPRTVAMTILPKQGLPTLWHSKAQIFM